MFGAVLVGKKGEGYNCGQVRGPLQLTFARSIDPVVPLDLSITRVALENPGDKPREDEDEKAATGTMGRKELVPYGLYRSYGFFSPEFAKVTGAGTDDLALFWDSLKQMWDVDHSASRGSDVTPGTVRLHTRGSRTGTPQLISSSISSWSSARTRTSQHGSSGTMLSVRNGAAVPQGVTLTRLVG